MRVGDKVVTVFGIGFVEEVSDTHAWVELYDGTMAGIPLAQMTVMDQ